MKLLNLSKSTNYWYGRIRSSSSWQILLHKIRLQGTLKRKLKLENLSLNIPDIKSIKTCNIIILFRNTAAPVSTFSSKLIALLYIFFWINSHIIFRNTLSVFNPVQRWSFIFSPDSAKYFYWYGDRWSGLRSPGSIQTDDVLWWRGEM